MKISEILHCAADKYLAANELEIINNIFDKFKFSCHAIEEASDEYYFDSLNIIKGLQEMGCPIHSSFAFGDPAQGATEEIQGMRYFWLKWAALMAEEQGV